MTRSIRLVTLGALASACGSAGAHSPIPGVGHFYAGMLHPLLVPAHLLAIVAMGLWLGQRWPANGNALLALAFAVPVGMAAGAVTGWQKGELVILTLTAIVAVFAGADRDVPVTWLTGIAAALGALLGIDSLPDGLSGRALWLSFGGTWLAILLGLSWTVAVSEIAARPWMKIGLRVVASWVAAAAILVLALSWFGPRAKLPAAASTPASAAR